MEENYELHKVISPGLLNGIPIVYTIDIKDGVLTADGRIMHSNEGLQIWGGNRSYFGEGFRTRKDWNDSMLDMFLNIAEEWSDNNYNRSCQHQRLLGWDDLANKTVALFSYSLKKEAVSARKRIRQEAFDMLLEGKSVSLSPDQIEVLKLEPNIRLPSPDQIGDLAKWYEPNEDMGFPSTSDAQWVSPKEHPDGLLGKECPVCGYKYGTTWITIPLPNSVIEFLERLPDYDNKYDS